MEFLTKLEHCIQQYPSNVNNWDPNRTPKPDKDMFLYQWPDDGSLQPKHVALMVCMYFNNNKMMCQTE